MVGGGFQVRDRRLAAATSVTQSDLRALPTPRRTFTNLAQLSPLVAGGQSIFGQAGRNNSILIDGVNAREAPFGGGGDSPYKLSMEALQEFEVVTNSYDVTDGRGAFGGIRATTRSGTNQFQGSLFGFQQDEGPGFKVLHVQDVDYETTCPTLVGCLEEVRDWSLGAPQSGGSGDVCELAPG